MTIQIDESVFNVNRTYESSNSLFLQEKRGLVDTINGTHEQLEHLYKLLKKQDWDETEFAFANCKTEFAAADPREYKAVRSTIAWQWEADSMAAHQLVAMMAPFVTNDSLWALYVEINRNEIVHGRTYSKIVELSFDNPQEIMGEILEDMDALRRMKATANAFGKVLRVGRMLMDGQIDRTSNEARDAAMLAVGVLYIMESLQFMASFGVTFAYGNLGKYIPVANAVQKICADEGNIHARAGEIIIEHELKTEEGRASWARIRDELSLVFAEVSENEHNWIEKIHEDPDFHIKETTKEGFHDWVRYCELRTNKVINADVILDDSPTEIMEFLPKWVDMNSNQGSPQETRLGNYLLGGFVDDLPAGEKLDLAMV